MQEKDSPSRSEETSKILEFSMFCATTTLNCHEKLGLALRLHGFVRKSASTACILENRHGCHKQKKLSAVLLPCERVK